MTVLRRLVSLGCLLAVIAVADQQARDAIATTIKGLDLLPLRHAGVALLHGASIYSDPRYVYPPTAAVALLPLSVGRYATTVDVWLVVSAVAVAAAGFLSMTPWRRGLWLLASVLAAGLMVKSDALTDTLWIGNVSLLLAPVAVGVLLLFEAQRWRTGTALLVLSLLIKPLLLPLIVLPLLRRQWQAVAQPVIAGGVLLGTAILLVPGGEHFFVVLRFLEDAGTLIGRAAVYNVSIRGLAERLDAAAWGSAARVVVVASTAVAAYVWARAPSRPGGTAAIGTLLMLAVILAGSLSEDHYLLVAAPCLLTAIALGGRLSVLAAALPGLVLFAFPRHYLGNLGGSPQGLQVRYVLAELLLAMAAAVAVTHSVRGDPSETLSTPYVPPMSPLSAGGSISE
jgi:hypothetical protein